MNFAHHCFRSAGAQLQFRNMYATHFRNRAPKTAEHDGGNGAHMKTVVFGCPEAGECFCLFRLIPNHNPLHPFA